MSDVVKYLEDILWVQDLFERAVQLNQAQRLVVLNSHVLMGRKAILERVFLIRIKFQWQGVDPDCAGGSFRSCGYRLSTLLFPIAGIPASWLFPTWRERCGCH